MTLTVLNVLKKRFSWIWRRQNTDGSCKQRVRPTIIITSSITAILLPTVLIIVMEMYTCRWDLFICLKLNNTLKTTKRVLQLQCICYCTVRPFSEISANRRAPCNRPSQSGRSAIPGILPHDCNKPTQLRTSKHVTYTSCYVLSTPTADATKLQ